MAKVITFSRTFPKGHPREGEPTNFVESFYKSLYILKVIPKELAKEFNFDAFDNGFAKHHTIRQGNRFKKGEFFSPRVWSGKPYHSKQIIIAPDTEIKQVWGFEIDAQGFAYINGKQTHRLIEIATNDGLQPYDFDKWFIPNASKFEGFKGQIICWNENIIY